MTSSDNYSIHMHMCIQQISTIFKIKIKKNIDLIMSVFFLFTFIKLIHILFYLLNFSCIVKFVSLFDTGTIFFVTLERRIYL